MARRVDARTLGGLLTRQKVDVDRQAELAQRYSVRAMPTFKFLKGGREVAEVGFARLSII